MSNCLALQNAVAQERSVKEIAQERIEKEQEKSVGQGFCPELEH